MGREPMNHLIQRMWADDTEQNIPEYALILVVVLVIIVGTVRLLGLRG